MAPAVALHATLAFVICLKSFSQFNIQFLVVKWEIHLNLSIDDNIFRVE